MASSTTLYVAGRNPDGELGIGARRAVTILSNWNEMVKTHLKHEIFIKHIHCGYTHTIFVDINNNHYISGSNQNGQIGQQPDSHSYQLAPKKMTFCDANNLKIIKAFTSINSLGTFWLLSNGEIYANGCNGNFQLGLPRRLTPWSSVTKPTKIPILQNVIDIKGGHHNPRRHFALCSSLNLYKISCIIQYWHKVYIPNEIIMIIIDFYYKITTNSVYKVGSIGEDKKNNTDQWSKIQSLENENIIKIAGTIDVAFFLDKSGVLWGCGENYGGQLGVGNSDNMTKKRYRFRTPIQIEWLIWNKIKVKDIECGGYHSLCLDVNGNIFSWGFNRVGQCGNGTVNDVYKPTIIEKLKYEMVVGIKCGYNHSYAKTKNNDQVDDEKYFLWGDNMKNQCGLKEDKTTERTPILIPFLINEIVNEITNGKVIIDVFLGNQSTFILTK